jgi:hypothetical protein
MAKRAMEKNMNARQILEDFQIIFNCFFSIKELAKSFLIIL